MTIDATSLWPALRFALSGAAISMVVGGAVGSILGTLEVPARRWLIGATTALLAAPPAFWWIGLTRLPLRWGTIAGSTWGSVVAGVAFAPITLLLVLAATQEVPSTIYEAARVSLGPVRRVTRVLLPLVKSALAAGFLLTTILLLGESEIPFLFGFRTAMTDLVTTFSQTFDAARTLPIILPLIVAVLLLATMVVAPLFKVILAGRGTMRGIIRRPASFVHIVAAAVVPFLVVLAIVGFALTAFSDAGNVWGRVRVAEPAVVVSIVEPVLCSVAAIALAVIVMYPLRRSPDSKAIAVAGLLLFAVPTAVIAIGWILVGQALRLSFHPAVAHVSRMMGLALLGFLVAYARVPRSLEQSAELVAVSPLKRAWQLILPLTAGSLAAAASLIAALVYADRDVPSLLLAPGDSRLMLNFYLLSANAPSALIGATALIVLSAGALVVALSALLPKLAFVRTRG